MNSTATSRRRPVPVVLLALVAALVGLFVAFAPTHDHAAAEDHADHGQASFTGLSTASRVAFHDQMRKLWEDHITWTRLAIVTFADGSNGFSATATRLLQNQVDIGDAVAPFYGTDAAHQLTALLHDHITIAVELLQDAKSGDTAAFQDAKTRWYDNANQIADFLSAANPRFWPDDVLRAAMKEHLDETLAEAADELGGNYAASVQDYEGIHQHMLEVADLLSTGIMRQFPSDFH